MHQYYSYTGFYRFVGKSVKKAVIPILLVIVAVFALDFYILDLNQLLIKFFNKLFYKMKSNNYLKFGLMMIVSFIIMYAVMFANVDSVDHIMLSSMRTYMAILMIAPMAVSMMLFMWGMYENKKLNKVIIGLAFIIFAVTFYMMRTQAGISDVDYMKGMIPHHSSAILTSQESDLRDPETKKLAGEIIKAQEEEIALMKELIEKLDKR